MTYFWVILLLVNGIIIILNTIYMVHNIGVKFDIIDPIVKSRLNNRFLNNSDF